MTGIIFNTKIIKTSIKNIFVLYFFIKKYVYINIIILTNNDNNNE